MESGPEVFQRFLRGERIHRPAFVPLMGDLLAEVEGTSWQSLTSDPTLWANSLKKTADLFGLDGVVAGMDPTLLAEACGCELNWDNDIPILTEGEGLLSEEPEASGRMKHALEAADRVFHICRADRVCVAALTGPATLAVQLFGPKEGPNHLREVKGALVRAAEAFCKTGPHILLFMEGPGLDGALSAPGFPRVYQTLRNIAAYYNITTGLYVEGFGAGDLEALGSFRMDLYMAGPSMEGPYPAAFQWASLGGDSLGIGLGIPLDRLEDAGDFIEQGIDLCRSAGGRGLFFTSCGPVGRDTDFEALHQIVHKITGIRI
ncbi:MAG: hypothetical protein K9L83_10695 [Deltaproteobacteria bacterium]|nr:hypothetical protein [Deltaproteobacteria bacterium]